MLIDLCDLSKSGQLLAPRCTQYDLKDYKTALIKPYISSHGTGFLSPSIKIRFISFTIVHVLLLYYSVNVITNSLFLCSIVSTVCIYWMCIPVYNYCCH